MPVLFIKAVQSIVTLIFKSAAKDIKKNGLIVGANKKRVLRDWFPTEEERRMRDAIDRSLRNLHKKEPTPTKKKG